MTNNPDVMAGTTVDDGRVAVDAAYGTTATPGMQRNGTRSMNQSNDTRVEVQNVPADVKTGVDTPVTGDVKVSTGIAAPEARSGLKRF